jgi:hypothetical protein
MNETQIRERLRPKLLALDPVPPRLLADLEAGQYFEPATTMACSADNRQSYAPTAAIDATASSGRKRNPNVAATQHSCRPCSGRGLPVGVVAEAGCVGNEIHTEWNLGLVRAVGVHEPQRSLAVEEDLAVRGPAWGAGALILR